MEKRCGFPWMLNLLWPEGWHLRSTGLIRIACCQRPQSYCSLVQSPPARRREGASRLLIPVLALKVEEAGPSCLSTFPLDTEICVSECVSTSRFVVSAAVRAGDINDSLPGDADLHNSSRLRGRPPPSLTALRFSKCLPARSLPEATTPAFPSPLNDALGWINPLNTTIYQRVPGDSHTHSIIFSHYNQPVPAGRNPLYGYSGWQHGFC